MFFLLPALLALLDFTYSESIAGSPGQRLMPLVLLFFVTPILARLAIAYDVTDILAVMSTFLCWNYMWFQVVHLFCGFPPYSRRIYSEAAFLDVSVTFAFLVDQPPLPVTISLSIFATILVFLLTEYIFYKLLCYSEGEAGVFEHFHAYIWGVLSFLQALFLFACCCFQEGAGDRGDLGRVWMELSSSWAMMDLPLIEWTGMEGWTIM